MEVSIIIPTLNEARFLQRTLDHVHHLRPRPEEVLIVDGGSTDGTVAIAEGMIARGLATGEPLKDRAPIKLLHSKVASRAVQMNLGADQAQGRILCFLHGDTLVPDDAIAVIQKTLADPEISGGGFLSLMTGHLTTRWGVSLHNALKTYYAPLLFRPHLYFRQGLRLLFGDQVMFCRREDFLACGGFNPKLPIMEEADLCLKLCRFGRIRQVNRVVQSSDRRVAAWGFWKANGIYLIIGLLWGLGVSAKTLKRFYAEVR
jgi:rSAM/selenodomain-associated transferase 2